MERIIMALTALLPTIGLIVYIYERDRLKKEPVGWLLTAFLFGAVGAAVVNLLGYSMFNTGQPFDFFESLDFGFWRHAIPDELAKFIMLWLLLHINKHYDEHIDSIVYSTCVALGYVGANHLYYFFSTATPLSSCIMLAIVLVPLHFCYGAIMGWFYGRSRFSNHNKWWAWFMALLVTTIVDGIVSAILVSIDFPSYYDITIFLLLFLLLIVSAVILICLSLSGIKYMLSEDESELNLHD